MNEQSITLWGAGTSRTIRPIWVAEELGLNYSLKPIGPRTGETQTESYTRINPKQKIPALQDGNLELSESVAICRYLVNRYGSTSTILSASTHEEQAKQDEWLSFIYGELDETSLYVIRRHEALSSIYGEAPNAIAAAREYFQKQIIIVDDHLRDKQFLVNDKFGVADIFLTTCLDWANRYKIPLSKNTKIYLDRMIGRPGYKAAVLRNRN